MSVPQTRTGVGGIHRPPQWVDAIARIPAARARRALILGPRDVGKSTFARELLRSCRKAGWEAALLDTDVGQKMVGPPACVTLGHLGCDDQSALSSLAFVGATDPVRGWREMISGATRLMDENEADLVVINTSGLLAGPGRRLKASKIEALEPEVLVGIGNDPDLAVVLGAYPSIPSYSLAPSVHASRKSEGARRSARREAFRVYCRCQRADGTTPPFSGGDHAKRFPGSRNAGWTDRLRRAAHRARTCHERR